VAGDLGEPKHLRDGDEEPATIHPEGGGFRWPRGFKVPALVEVGHDEPLLVVKRHGPENVERAVGQ